MAAITVTHKLVDPAGNPVQMGGLITLGGFFGTEWRRVQAMSPDGQAVTAVPADSDASGVWSTTLVPNSAMDLENTLYRYQPASGDPVHFIVPATGGPYELRNLIAITPGTPARIVTGPPGPTGPPLRFGDPVPTAGDLPTTGTTDEAHLADDTGHVWVWTVNETTQVGSWVDTGMFRGPQGIQGVKGDTGLKGDAGAKGDKGDTGLTGPPGVIQSIVQGTGITVDNTDPANPVVAATGGGGSGTVQSVVQGAGIAVDTTDPANPIVSADLASTGLTDFDTTAPTNGQVPTWNGTKYAPATPSGGGGAAGINASSTATQLAIETAKDWIAVSDAGLWTGEVLGYLIGSAFDPYRGLQTIQQVADNSGAASVLQGNSNALGAVQRSTIGFTVFGPLFGVKPGDPFMGGFFVGIIDTTKGNIIAADASQSGKRYGLIVSPKTLETTKMWKATNDAGPSGVQTRWDGLDATIAMATAGAAYEAATYCNGLTAPVDAASQWYLPAMDELELIYRILKPVTYDNNTSSSSSTFPPVAQFPGVNPSSDPSGATYTTSNPARTIVAAFQTGGAEDIGQTSYWCATEGSAPNAWLQYFTFSSYAGLQNASSKNVSLGVRPVRRLVLSSAA